MKNATKRTSELAVGQILTKEEMKKVIGGKAPSGCSVSVNCVKSVFNSTTNTWSDVQTGTASCSGTGDCTTTSSGVTCTDTGGASSTGSCSSDSHPA